MGIAHANRVRHPPARDAIDQAETPTRASSIPADENLGAGDEADAIAGPLDCLQHRIFTRAPAAFARAKHALRAKAAAVLDSGIASLERLRQAAGGGEDAGDESGHDRAQMRSLGGRRASGPDTPGSVAPKPRRVRSLFVHLCVLLAGAMAGLALAYNLLAQLLERRAATISRQEINLSKYSTSAAEFEKKLKLEQAKLAQAEQQLAAVHARDATTEPQGEAGGGRARASGQQSQARSADCTLRGSNIRSTLIGCIDDLNRH